MSNPSEAELARRQFLRPGNIRAMGTKISCWIRSAAHDSARARWLMIFLPVSLIMLVTTNYGPIYFVDGAAAFHPAWHLAQHGHLFVEDAPLRIFAFVEGRDEHLFSNRPPGLIAAVIPSYFLLPSGETPSGVPAAVTISLFAAGSVATLGLILELLVSRKTAVYGALVAGLGTSMWSVAAAEFFPHSVNIFWLMLALLMLTRERDIVAGVAMAMAITTRPHLAVIAFVLGLWAGWVRRSFRTVVNIGFPAMCGLGLVMLYNRWIFSEFNLRGGYGDYVNSPLSGELPGSSGAPFFENIVGSLLSGTRGLLVLTPVLLLLLPGLPRAWSRSPWWAKASAVAGTGYMVVQWQIQSGEAGFIGGYLFYSYRYTLEWLLLMAPMLAVAYREYVDGHTRRVQLTVMFALVSIWIHGVGAIFYDLSTGYSFHPWLAWSPWMTLMGSSPTIQTAALIALATLIALPPFLVREGRRISPAVYANLPPSSR